jgi:hypothetical protein
MCTSHKVKSGTLEPMIIESRDVYLPFSDTPTHRQIAAGIVRVPVSFEMGRSEVAASGSYFPIKWNTLFTLAAAIAMMFPTMQP